MSLIPLISALGYLLASNSIHHHLHRLLVEDNLNLVPLAFAKRRTSGLSPALWLCPKVGARNAATGFASWYVFSQEAIG